MRAKQIVETTAVAVAVSSASARTYECARCGKRQTADQMVFSTFSRNHYCAAIDKCGRRASKAGQS